jgi:hypothetical protein
VPAEETVQEIVRLLEQMTAETWQQTRARVLALP